MKTPQATGICALKRTAFTLVEMLVVIAIIAIVAAMSVMAFAPFMRGQTLSQAVSIVQSSIWQTRDYAATHRTKATLYFDTEEGKILIFKTPDDADKYADPAIADPEPVSKPEFLPEGVNFAAVQGAGADKPVVILKKEDGNLKQPLEVRDEEPNQTDRLVFHPSGSLDPLNMNHSTSNWYVVLEDKKGQQMVIEVIFASGLTRIHEP